MSSPTNNHTQQQVEDEQEDRNILSPASTSSSSLSTSLENTNTTAIPTIINSTNTTSNVDKPLPPPPPPTSTPSSTTTLPNPTRSLSATTTPTIRSPPNGGGSQTKRHSVRSNSASQHRQASSSSLETRSISQPPQRPTSPITSPSIHKSLTALDAKSITRDMEKSALQLRGDDMISPSSPNASSMAGTSNFYFASTMDRGPPSMSFQSMSSVAPPTSSNASSGAATAGNQNPNLNQYQYHRQNSFSSVTLPATMSHTNSNSISNTSNTLSLQGDAWQTLCVRVLPLFNGEGVQGAIEDLNDLLRRCLSDSISPKFYRDIEALLRDGMFTLNAKMFGVTDEKLLDRLVEQWSFFFTYALPYFEAVFLPLRTDVRYRSPDEAEMWNVRNMALRSFRDNVILLQTKRLEDVFNKLFTDFGSSQNPAATAAKMLQMTSLLASSPDHNEEIERVLSNLKANWKIMMTKRDRRGFAGVRKTRPSAVVMNGGNSSNASGGGADSANQMFSALQ